MKPTTIVVLLFCALIAGIIILVLRSDGAHDDQGSESKDGAANTVILRGASQFDETHAFTRTIRKFEQLVKEYYDGPVEFEVYLNSELGLEKDYFAYMSQGLSVDYGIVTPAHMSTFSKSAPLIDMPFLFRDIDHWNKVLDGDAFQPIAEEVQQKADVMIVGYAGGGTRNLIVNRPVTSMADLQGLNVRVMGAPIQTRIFQAIHTSPTVISYSEIYNAIQTGVIDAAENEAAGIQQMKFYEVGPEISLTQHAITVRPLCFSAKTFRRLPKDLQLAIERAGREAGAYGRHLESTEDAEILDRMKTDGMLRLHQFTERDELMRLAEPVKAAYAKEIDAVDVLSRVNAVQ
ncbi:MAG: TRAP transporter substrate-binding protein [Fuerstiella sp.]|nr:TRAP transporter substrate-binding protein [Fuerstiella sp.]MCP4857399.1 TRAP transporter substrate-binding protein [Fuerstiella sp.]